ncbi:putative metal dependent phosphohydrolase [Desulfuromonas soudanensis]|uniref:Putative metal dependent phosphohydrolase n=1 Tax=Desulfuromonas soudanensis TaxID=1603606 RepID=A0A0M3QFW0_9BACT|nr:HD domain-containing protein [Desulfuromonas soudanensis]ALC16753.1 putative metal dependent phosphohydrolase [Desulfuromonas soudanensis]
MNLFLDRVRLAMEEYFGSDVRRIAHAHAVTGYAAELLAYIDADEVLTIAAAYLHDIGIPEAERKFGSCNGALQEQEGPPVARALLEKLAAPADFTEQVCALVGAHHTPKGVDSPEFRILWDADALVNLAEVVPGKTAEEIEAILHRALVTEAGYRRARAIFL